MESDSLQVDLADPDDVRQKLPQATRILRRKAQIAIDSVDDYQSFRELVTYLAKRAGTEPPRDHLARTVAPTREEAPQPAEPSAPSVLDLVVEVVNRELRAIRPRDVRDILTREGHTFDSADSVSNALNYAFRRERVQLVERGWYAPLGFRPESQASLSSGGPNGGP